MSVYFTVNYDVLVLSHKSLYLAFVRQGNSFVIVKFHKRIIYKDRKINMYVFPDIYITVKVYM